MSFVIYLSNNFGIHGFYLESCERVSYLKTQSTTVGPIWNPLRFPVWKWTKHLNYASCNEIKKRKVKLLNIYLRQGQSVKDNAFTWRLRIRIPKSQAKQTCKVHRIPSLVGSSLDLSRISHQRPTWHPGCLPSVAGSCGSCYWTKISHCWMAV